MSPALRSLILLALLSTAASEFLPPASPSSGNVDVLVLQPSGATVTQALFYQGAAWYLPLSHVANVHPATCDEARAANLPNVGCFKIGGEIVSYYSQIRLLISDSGQVRVELSDTTYCVSVGMSQWGGTPFYSVRWSGASACLEQSTPAWGSMDLIGTAFALNDSGVFQAAGSDTRAISLVYTDNNQRATFTVDGHCGGFIICTPTCNWGNHLLPLVGIVMTSPSPSATYPSTTPSPSTSSTNSSMSSLTPGLSCPPSLFRSLPRTDLVGAPLTDAPLAVASEGACRIACCDAPGCDGYAFAFTELRFSSTASCVLLANVSAMAPNNFATSGLRRNMPSFSPTASMTMSPSPSSVIFLSPVSVTDLDGRSFYQGDPNLPHHGPITNLIDGDLATDWDPSCCGTYRLVFTLSALHSITSIRLSIWQNEFSASHVSIYDAPGGNLLRAMTWPYWNLTTIITIPHYVGDRFYLEYTSRIHQVICNEVSFSIAPTGSSTSAPSASASPSVSSTLTPGLNCPSSMFRALPHADLVGVVIDMIAVFSQELCRIACCNGVECQGFAFARTELRFGAGASCFLYANITQFIPSSAFSSGILESTL